MRKASFICLSLLCCWVNALLLSDEEESKLHIAYPDLTKRPRSSRKFKEGKAPNLFLVNQVAAEECFIFGLHPAVSGGVFYALLPASKRRNHLELISRFSEVQVNTAAKCRVIVKIFRLSPRGNVMMIISNVCQFHLCKVQVSPPPFQCHLHSGMLGVDQKCYIHYALRVFNIENSGGIYP